MGIILGSARCDENGKYSGGKVGDQTGREVMTQNYYTHSKGWYVLRPKDVNVADKIAEGMRIACSNDNIGYDQSNRLGVIKYGINTNTKTECDCSSLIRACIIYATGKDVGNFTTGNEASLLEASGLFEKRISYTSSTIIYDGDVLVTKTKGHTVAAVSGNPRVAKPIAIRPNTDTDMPVIKRGSKGATVGKLQSSLLLRNFKTCTINGVKKELKIDEDFGQITEAVFIRWQGYVGLVQDGVCGPKSWDKLGY